MGKYADIIASSQAEIDQQRARSAGIVAPKVQPDSMGQAMKIADARGLPVGVVADNLPDYDEQEELDGLSGAASQSPVLARWLGDPNQTALAKDDTGVLGKIGSLFATGLLSQSKVIPGLAMPSAALDVAMADVRKQQAIEAGPVARAVEQPSWFSELVGTFQRGWQGGKQATVMSMDAFDIGPAVMDPSTGKMTRDRSGETGALIADLGRKAEGTGIVSDATEKGMAEIQGAEGWTGTAAAIAVNPRAVMSVVAQSLGSTAPQLALSASLPASKFMGALVGGTGSFSAEQGFTVLDVMGESGVDTTDASQVTAFLRDKPAMEAARAKAVKRGVAIGAFDALTAGFAGRILANSRRGMVSVGSRVAAEGGLQAAGGATGEAAAQLVTEGRITSQSDVLLEAAAEMPTFLAEGRGRIADARRAAANNADKFDALGEQASVSKLVQLAGESKTRTRSASRFESLIQDMTDDGNDTIYLPVDAAQKLFQSAADGEANPLATLVDDAAMREAAATGGEVAIPLAQYVAAVTPEQHATVAQAIRLQPGTRHDIEMVSSEDIQAAIAEGLAEGRATDERENGPAGQVYDEIYGQLLAKQDDKLARQSASIVQSVYRNLAERSGMDPWALFQQFRINIPGAKSDSRGQRRGVDLDVDPYLDALRTGKLPTDKDIYGDSLVAALHAAGGIRESGGELANMYAAKLRPGLVNNLAGMTMDDALVWAHQEGFIAEAPTQLREEISGDAPDINTLLDLLAQDLGGNPVYRPNALNAERAGFRETAQSLQEELDAAGVDLAKLDNKAARAALGPSYNQDEAPTLYQSPIPEDATVEQLRAKIAELEVELRTDDLTGVRNRRAFNEDESLGWEGVMAFDMDGLKALNNFGHDVGDEALRQIGAVLLGSETPTARFYRKGGDEFYGRAATREEAERLAQMVQDKLESVDVEIDLTDSDGNLRSLTYRGIGISRGSGANENEADQQAIRNKDERIASGQREAPGANGTPRRIIERAEGDRRGGSDQEPRRAAEATVDGLNQAGAKAPRGSVTFGKDSSGRIFNIELLAGMDASTFMHEMGHVYLEVVNDLAARDGAPEQLKVDIATLDAWLKREPGAAFTVDQHEQFARGFEAYLREGSAPTAALRRAFAAFKVWLTNIYRSIASLNVELTDDVRGVMDRIVASDAEIEEARGTQYHEALITDAIAVGMSPESFEAYNAAVSLAREDAEAVVAADVLTALQREQKAWWRQEKQKVREEVVAELREQPVYRAQRILRTGRMPDGTDAPDVLRVKLDKEDLLDKYGQSFLRNLAGMYRVEGGVRADEVASLLGFGSGREMVDALVNAPSLNEAAAAETDARMAVRHPDPMTDGTLPDRAMVASHRDRQAAVMVSEIRALESHVNGRARSQGAVIKGVAQAIIAEKKLRHLQPATYKAAEARAGKEAFEAASSGDWAAALAARRRQLLNFELFREAVRARDEAQSAAKFLTRFTKGKDRARLGKVGGDYLDQVDGLLDRFDFHKISDKAADRRARLGDWVTAQAAAGIDLNLPTKLLDEAFRTPYREMTMGDLRALRDAVKSIDHLARLKGKLLLAGELRDAAEVDEAMAKSLADNWKARPVTTGDKPTSAKVRQAFQQGRVLQGTATDIARELDGFVDRGAVWKNTVGVIREAINNQVNPRLKQAQEDIAGVYLKHYTKAEIRDFGDLTPMPEVNGDLWSKRRLLSLALNWGNEGNREAILSQGKAPLTPEQAAALLGRLDARDWAFVGDMWQLIDGQWPDIAAAQKRRTGLVPERVQPTPFTVTTSDGRVLSIPGGYYPLKYEADSVKTMKEEADDFYNSIRTGRTAKASTKNGHTIERVGSGGRTVNLDTSVISQHLRDVIRDVHLGDAVNYVHNVLNGQQFKEAVDTAGVTEYQRALEVWLKDAAAGEIGPRVWHERFMRTARTNFTASVLTFKTTSALLQLTGVVPSSVVVGQRNMISAIAQFVQRPVAMGRYIRESSPYMASRLETTVEAVQQVMDAEAGRFEAGKSAAMRWGYWMIGRVQSLVDSVTWLAAEQAGMRKFGGDIDAARQYADDVVTRAQSSAEFVDKSPLQRGTLGDNVRQTEWVKATTALQSYMIAKGNLAYEVTGKTNFRDPKQAMKWAADMVMLYSVEGLIAATLTGKLPGDDDDDGILDDLGEWMLKDTAGQLVGSMPGGGVVTSQLRGYDSGGVLANAWGAYGDVIEQVKQGEMDRAAVKSAVTAAGVTLGLPSSQINKTIEAIAASRDGKDVSPLEYLTGPKKK